MSMRLSHEVFERQGYAWNTPNWQHNSGVIITHRRNPDGSLRDVEVSYEVEGYGADGEPTRAPERKVHRDPAPVSSPRPVTAKRRVIKARAPEYRCIVPVAPVVPSDAKMPSEADLLKGKRQRAAVKARLTRAQNKLKREEAERVAGQDQLLVKILTMKGLFA